MRNSALNVAISSMFIAITFFFLWGEIIIISPLNTSPSSEEISTLVENHDENNNQQDNNKSTKPISRSSSDWLSLGKEAEKNGDISLAIRFYSWALNFSHDENLQKHIQKLNDELEQKNKLLLADYNLWQKAIYLESILQYQEALAIYRQFIDKNWFEDVKKRIQYCESELQKNKQKDSFFVMAEEAFEKAEFQKAIAIYQGILTKSPENIRVQQEIKKIQKHEERHLAVLQKVNILQKQERYVYALRYLKHDSLNKNYFKNIITELKEHVDRQMVHIPPGKFIFGSNTSEDEAPEQQIYLDGFHIDRYEVTNKEYYHYMQLTGVSPPQSWKNSKLEEKEEKLPVTGISWNEALQYCYWLGKTLPTEQQWEKAARGTNGNIYPWGNSLLDNTANTMDSGLRRTSEIGSYPAGQSPFGCYDMIGNVMEWTLDDYKAYSKENVLSIRPGYKVARGGNWYYKSNILYCSKRYPQEPNVRLLALGFRCAIETDKIE